VKSHKGLAKFLIYLFIVVAALVSIVFAAVRLGYLTPDTKRCSDELLYHWVQNREPVAAKTFEFPLTDVKRPWLWAPGAAIGQDPTLMWFGACKGVPAPNNENVRVSFDGIGMLLIIWVLTSSFFGFNKRRLVGLLVMLVIAFLLVPHGSTSLIASRFGGWTAWVRFILFALLGLAYGFISWKALNSPAAKATPGVVTVTPVAVK
jgi:hypothetical protein